MIPRVAMSASAFITATTALAPVAILVAAMILGRASPRRADAAVAPAAPAMPPVPIDVNAGVLRLSASTTALEAAPPAHAPGGTALASGPFRAVAHQTATVFEAEESPDLAAPRCTAIMGGRVPLAIIDGRARRAGDPIGAGWTLVLIDAAAREVLVRDDQGTVYRHRLHVPTLRSSNDD